jgi:multiple sugar transport system permease protein
LLRIGIAFVIMAIGIFWMSSGYGLMLAEGDRAFIGGLTITFYYAFGSVPIQLGLGLVFAYLLYKNIKGRELYRMLLFLPYVTPQVAAAVVFRIVFNPRDGLVNTGLTSVGLEPQRWINEAAPFLNAFFGWDLEGFIAGPSMALVSIIILGIWTYAGYNAVIFLAGLGGIPEDLYEAARVDGASEWHIFRHVTLPLLSPITFYLSILAFIGTFKAFNTIYVMRTPFARGSVDTASIVVFDTFQKDFQYGLATAQAILLFFIILGLTQVQRTFFERKVFYG